jgi:hypothetical protein
MQTELEKWIERHQLERYNGGGIRDMTITTRDLRALLEGKVLCNAEPVGYFDRYDFEDMRKAGMSDMTMVVAGAPLGYLCCPLYAPASLAGNADISPKGEAGKEGGE